MNKQSLVSVIVPCYNQGKYIQECLDSVHQQSYKNYEIIVINDGSTDTYTNNTIKRISHPKVKVLETLNQGVSMARNEAIKTSQGKYILPLDADDKIETDYISKAVTILENNADIKVVNCAFELFGAKKGVRKFESYTLERLICKNILAVSSVFKRTDFERTIGFNSNLKEGFEDWDFWLSLLKTGGSVYTINEVGFYYRIKRNSRNSSLDRSRYKKLRRQIYENHRELYAKYLLAPQECFEYEILLQSREYKLGVLLLKPLRYIQKLLY